MSDIDPCDLLTREIVLWFEGGIPLDDHARRYIDACLPGMTLEALASSISDTPDLEMAPLLDLIFFPDQALQMRLEPLLEAHAFGPEDEDRLVTRLASAALRTTLHGPGNRKSETRHLPPHVLGPFVRRLGISRRIPVRIAETITRQHPPAEANRVKVLIRNARLSLSASAGDFLNSFLLGMVPGDLAYDACLDLTLAVLREQALAADPFQRLRLKLDALHRARDAALAFERQLRSNNMETLMQMGIRAPETGVAEAEIKIGLLERIGDAVALGGVISRRQV